MTEDQKEKRRQYDKERYQKNREFIRSQHREYQKQNREILKQKANEYRRKNREIILQKNRNYSKSAEQKLKRRKRDLTKTYGITFDDYKRIWFEQNGCCGICRRFQKEIKRPLFVDHCHETGKLRGLLCHNCNAALGLLKEDVTVMQNLINYTLKHRN